MINSKTSLFVGIRTIYEKAKSWIVSLNLILIIILIYLGDFLGPLRDFLLPAAIVSIVAILFEILQKLETSFSVEAYKEFSTFTEAIPTLLEQLSHDRKRTTVDIITGPGGTTLSSLLPKIIRSSNAKVIEITIHILDPNSPLPTYFPQHWLRESQLSIDRLTDESYDERFHVRIFSYNHMPVLRGVMINREHLLIGFFAWSIESGRQRLRGAEKPHLYFDRSNPNAKFFFEFFENWIEHCPVKPVFDNLQRAEDE